MDNNMFDLFKTPEAKREERLKKDIFVSNEAKQIYESELIKSFFKDLYENIQDKTFNSTDEDKEGRERLYLFRKVVKAFEQMFLDTMQTGTMSGELLEKLHKGAFRNL